jgi:hypothetical protein
VQEKLKKHEKDKPRNYKKLDKLVFYLVIYEHDTELASVKYSSPSATS